MSKSKIFEWIQDTYQVKSSQSQRLYREAMRDLEETFNNSDITEIKIEYAERIESWIEKAVNSGDINTAIKAQEMLNKLFGLYTENKNINLNTDNITFEFN